ncbi:type-1 angiotensin II receptor-associated protein isoform X1 [Macrosteles quadrilineatus]|uniref:type-1 angiotensin II receptor-associated protein isoform X1 n=1 Tax=Macrosteles quadrilineatus TaxID=74068 RepID=UPI0023E15741|nr:type-1 angiotensin II receptor-associated protein isoform X1 [Macrosteles quadrilineatus]
MVDVDLNSVPSINLKIIFGVHFILITWGIQGHWSPDSYFFYNLVFILTLLWGIHCKDKAEPIQIAMVIDGVSVLLDIFAVGMNTPSVYAGEKFSVAMALLNLALRPITVVLLGRVCADRMGLDDGFPARFGNLFGERETRGPYEDIERGSGASRTHQNIPSTETADFTPTYH